jgi:hypothetical protein
LNHETVTWLVSARVFNSSHFYSNFISIESFNFIEGTSNLKCAGTLIEFAHASAILMELISRNLALKVVCNSDLLRPGNLNRTRSRDGVNWSELYCVRSNIVKFGVGLGQLVLNDLSSKLILNTKSFLVGVGCHLVVILILDFDFFKAFRRSSGDRVTNVIDAPLESTSIFAELGELYFYDTARDSAFNLLEAKNR